MQSNPLSEQSSGPERPRAAPRYRFTVDVEIDRGSTVSWGRVCDISRRGMFIAIPDAPPVNSRFLARLAFDDPLPMLSVVKRVVPGEGIGVAIAAVDEDSIQRFNALLRLLGNVGETIAREEPKAASHETPLLILTV